MTAIEAKDLAIKANIKIIEENIKLNSEAGYFRYTYNKIPEKTVIQYFLAAGYNIEIIPSDFTAVFIWDNKAQGKLFRKRPPNLCKPEEITVEEYYDE